VSRSSAAFRPARAARAWQRALSGLGVLALGWWAGEAIGLQVHFLRQSRRLDALVGEWLPGALPLRARATRAEMGRTGLIGRIELPRLGLAAIVEEGVDGSTLSRAAGHVPGTALPGEPGNAVFAAHRDTVFRPLKDVRRGDVVRFLTPDGWFAYEVERVEVVDPHRIDVLAPTPGRRATLITCHPFTFVGRAPRRFIVHARATP